MALLNTLCARSLRSLALATALLGAVGAACARGYTDHQDGTVTDSATGLQWMRCAQGQTWTGSACSAGPARYTWAQATALSGSVSFAGHNDWRLPNIRELLSLVDRAAGNPAIDPVAFVDAPSGSFWSASARADTADSAWTVYFAYGNAFGTTLDSAVPGYLLRAYAATGSYIGINTSGAPRLYYLGPASAQTLLDLGPLADWLAQVTP